MADEPRSISQQLLQEEIVRIVAEARTAARPSFASMMVVLRSIRPASLKRQQTRCLSRVRSAGRIAAAKSVPSAESNRLGFPP
jgi:hypothetical protein